MGQDKVNEIDPHIMNMLHPSVSVPHYKFPQWQVCGFCCFLITDDFGFLILPPMLQNNYPHNTSTNSETAQLFSLSENATFCSSGFEGQERAA